MEDGIPSEGAESATASIEAGQALSASTLLFFPDRVWAGFVLGILAAVVAPSVISVVYGGPGAALYFSVLQLFWLLPLDSLSAHRHMHAMCKGFRIFLGVPVLLSATCRAVVAPLIMVGMQKSIELQDSREREPRPDPSEFGELAPERREPLELGQ